MNFFRSVTKRITDHLNDQRLQKEIISILSFLIIFISFKFCFICVFFVVIFFAILTSSNQSFYSWTSPTNPSRVAFEKVGSMGRGGANTVNSRAGYQWRDRWP